MKLRSGRKVFNNCIEGNEFLNTYCSISYISDRKIFRHHLKKIIKKWYIWLIKKHIETNYCLSPWYIFGLTIYNKWQGYGNDSMCLTSNLFLISNVNNSNCANEDSLFIE